MLSLLTFLLALRIEMISSSKYPLVENVPSLEKIESALVNTNTSIKESLDVMEECYRTLHHVGYSDPFASQSLWKITKTLIHLNLILEIRNAQKHLLIEAYPNRRALGRLEVSASDAFRGLIKDQDENSELVIVE